MAFWAAGARGNGGSSEFWLEGGVAGSLRPKQETTVRLVSETLRITIDRQPTLSQLADAAAQDGGPSDGYRVEARYTLANPGPAARALYAVPVVVTRVPVEDPGAVPQGYSTGLSGEELARRIRVSLGGESFPCAYVRRPVVPWAAFPDASYSAVPWVAVPEDLRIIGASLDEGEPLALDGFCAVALEIPHGTSQLTLTYAAVLFGSQELPWSKECDAEQDDCERMAAEDGEREECRERRAAAARHCPPRKTWTDAWLYYPLGAASSWAGTPDFVRVEVELGGFAFDRVSSRGIPGDAVESGGALRWTWKKPELAGKDFRLGLQKRGSAGAFPEDHRWCVPEIRARASSSLPSQGGNEYGGAEAVDGVAATAWCVNTPAGGIGEWIELTFPLDPEHARPMGLFLVPGYAKSQKAWASNGRVTRIRYGPCGARGDLREAKLEVPDAYQDAVAAVQGAEGVLAKAVEAAKDGAVCLRIEIAGTAAGARSKDVCLSEIRAPLLCW